jgi:hypothetical protein
VSSSFDRAGGSMMRPSLGSGLSGPRSGSMVF